MTQFKEEEGFDWWYKKLIAPDQSTRKDRTTDINSRDYICSSLCYCNKCDRLWERTGMSGGKYPKVYIEYFTRKDLSFFGFKDNEEKQKICMRCDEKEN